MMLSIDDLSLSSTQLLHAPPASPSRKNFLKILPDVLVYCIIFEYLLPSSDDPSSVRFLVRLDSIMLNRQDRNTFMTVMAMDACKKSLTADTVICRGLRNTVPPHTESYLQWLIKRRLAVKHIEFSSASLATTQTEQSIGISEFLKTYNGSHLIETVEAAEIDEEGVQAIIDFCPSLTFLTLGLGYETLWHRTSSSATLMKKCSHLKTIAFGPFKKISFTVAKT